MFLRLLFSQIMAEQLVDDHGIVSPWILDSLSYKDITVICDVITRTGGLEHLLKFISIFFPLLWIVNARNIFIPFYNFPLIIKLIRDVNIVAHGMISMVWLDNSNIIGEDTCIVDDRGDQNGCGSGRHCRERDSYGTRHRHNRLISSSKRWNGIFELVPFLAQKRSFLMKLLPMKIHGTPREMMVTMRFFPFLFQGVNMAFSEYIYCKKSNLLHE